MSDKTPNGMDPEAYKEQVDYALSKKYNDETIEEIKRRARGLLYRVDFDLFIVVNWIIDNFGDSQFKEGPEE